jgi:hypothetical protein
LPNTQRQADVQTLPGKTRMIGCALCRRCHGHPDSRQHVEDLIFADFARTRAAADN